MAQAASTHADTGGDQQSSKAAEAPLRLVPQVSPQPDAAQIAERLYRATLDLLRWNDDPASQRHSLLEPLSKAVATQKTREGQRHCAAVEAALAARDYDTALDACLGLIDLARGASPPQLTE